MTRTTPHTSLAWAATTVHSEAPNPSRRGDREPAPWPLRRPEAFPRGVAEGFEPDRDDAVGLFLERGAPDRPAGRFVAVVTVSNRVVPERPDQGDTCDPGVERRLPSSGPAADAVAAPQTVTMTGTIIGR